MAIEIAVGPGADGADGVVVVDAADGPLRHLDDGARHSGEHGGFRTVVVHDVDALDPAQQTTLMALATDMAGHGTRPCRIIATTSSRCSIAWCKAHSTPACSID